MRVTQPMIERGVAAYRPDDFYSDKRVAEVVEEILRAALNDPKEPPKPIEGQMTVDDFPEAFERVCTNAHVNERGC